VGKAAAECCLHSCCGAISALPGSFATADKLAPLRQYRLLNASFRQELRRNIPNALFSAAFSYHLPFCFRMGLVVNFQQFVNADMGVLLGGGQ